MFTYVVAATDASCRLVALRDPAGRYHVAHCTSDLPGIEQELGGNQPAVGFALLIGTAGKVYRLIFSQINCGQRWALEQLHKGSVPQPETARASPAAR